MVLDIKNIPFVSCEHFLLKIIHTAIYCKVAKRYRNLYFNLLTICLTLKLNFTILLTYCRFKLTCFKFVIVFSRI